MSNASNYPGWKADEGYSGNLTTRCGDLAVVAYSDLTIEGVRYGFDVYDESDDEAMMYGRWEYRLFGIWSMDATIDIAEAWLSENC